MGKSERLVVTLTGGAPWGFRLSGGGGLPLIINQIRKKSIAHRKDLKEGDAVITINGVKVHDKTQDEALDLVEKSGRRLTLEIFRGDIDEFSQIKERKPIKVPHGVKVTAQTSDNSSFETSTSGFTMTATVDDVTSDSFHTPPEMTTTSDAGFTLTATVDDVSGTSFSTDHDVSSGGGFTLTSTVGEMTSATSRGMESSPVLLVADGGMTTSVHSAEVEAISASVGSPVMLAQDTFSASVGSPVMLAQDTFSASVGSPVMLAHDSISASVGSPVMMAQPYVDSSVIAQQPNRLSPNPPRSRSRSAKSSNSPNGPKTQTLSPVQLVQNGSPKIPSPQSNGPKSPQQAFSPKPQAFSPQSQTLSPQMQAFSPQPQTLSPKPQAFSPRPQTFSPQPQKTSPQQAVFSPQPQVFSPMPQKVSPQPQKFSPQPQKISPQPQKFSPQPQKISPQPQNFSPQPQIVASQPAVSRSPLQAWSPNPPASSPRPQPPAPAPQPQPVVVTPMVNRSVGSGGSTSVSSSTFDDGNTRREVTHQVRTSADGRNSSTLHRETTTTTTNKAALPFAPASAASSSSPAQTSAVKTIITTKSSAFNVVQQSATNGHAPQRNFTSSSTSSTLKTTAGRGPQQQQQQQQQQHISTTTISSSRSTGDLTPVFKPSRFVPGSGHKEIPGLYAPGSPMVDAEGNIVFGKENVAPQPKFQVKKIVSESSKSRGRDIWRPNVWLPDQRPASSEGRDEQATPTLRDDFSPYYTFPVPKVKPGYSLVAEQKKRLESQATRNDFDFDWDRISPVDDFHHRHHRRPDKLHVFAPPVEIHADGVYDSPTSPYITFSASGEPIYMYDYEDGPLSPESSNRKKNLYSDSAFYDTPGKNFPTITEQMQLCKKIAQSLTSAANRRARGAKMFMRRKRKSGKWVHEGHSEWSSSAGDVANIRELESELSPDEGGSKPLLYFKIPNLKNRVGSKAKQTKMALTQEQFERLRLEAKKCDHNAVPPDTCFGIVADLKAHKGKGGRMFERRRERSDKYVVDESTARASTLPRRFESVLSASARQDKTPWEAAMQHGGNVDAAFSHLTEWERNQRMNALLEGNRKVQPPAAAQKVPVPSFNTSLKSDGSSHTLRGKDFNRVARGWMGGGEYPVAERHDHVSPTRQTGPASPSTNYNNKIKAWQSAGQSPYTPPTTHYDSLPEPPRVDQWASQRQEEWQAPKIEFRPSSALQNPAPVRPVSWMSESYHSGVSREDDYTYAPVDYRYAPESYPTVAYMQPIIPGTDC